MNPRAEVYWRSRNGRSDENAKLRVAAIAARQCNPEGWRSRNGRSDENAKLRVAAIAARQCNRVTTDQLQRLGISRTTVGRWTTGGYLHPRLPRVYAVGSAARTVESDLWEAVLYAGPGAMLSHATAAKWLDMIDHWPPVIHVSTPRRRQSLSAIRVHPRRTGLTRTFHGAIPVTSIADTLLDLATADELTLVRRSFARLDYQRRLHTEIVRRACRRGRAGSVTLRAELDRYDPLMARTRSDLEVAYLRLGLPRPDAVNVLIGSASCDIVYYDAKLVVMLDGVGNHRSRAQVRRDLAAAFALRRAGWLVLRYGEAEIYGQPAAVRAEVVEALATRAGIGRRA
jgi:predicted transcriptional regulator of viral defense system